MLISSRPDQGNPWAVRTWEAGLGNQGKGNAEGIVLGVSVCDVNVELLLTCPLLPCQAFHCDLLLAPRTDGARARGHREHAKIEGTLWKKFQERLMFLEQPSREYILPWPPAGPKHPVPGQGRMTPWPKGSPRLRPASQEELQACPKWQRERSLSVKNEGGSCDPSASRGNTGEQK